MKDLDLHQIKSLLVDSDDSEIDSRGINFSVIVTDNEQLHVLNDENLLELVEKTRIDLHKNERQYIICLKLREVMLEDKSTRSWN